jgi:DNA polymerase III subunit beta
MRFSISTSELQRLLQLANVVIATNPAMPILEDVVFRIQGNRLSLQASDLETTITASTEITSDEDGEVAIPAKILTDTIKALPNQPVTFFVSPNQFKIEITSSYGKYQMAGESAADFPEIPVGEELDSITIPASVLRDSINHTLFATSSDELRPAMTGVNFDIDFSKFTTVATDAHKLVRSIHSGLEGNVSASFIMPKKGLNLLKNALPDKGDVQLSFNKTNVFVSFDNLSIVTRLIEGRYPDYNAVIPVDNPNNMSINREDLLNSIKRIAIFANKTTNQVVLNITDGNLTVSAQDLDFNNEATEQLPCRYVGSPMAIAFNAKFLAEMLGVLNSEEVNIELSAPSRAGIIKPLDGSETEDLLMLIMPVMLNS